MRPPRVSRAWKRVSKKVFVRNAVYHTTVVATAAATVASFVRTSSGPAEFFFVIARRNSFGLSPLVKTKLTFEKHDGIPLRFAVTNLFVEIDQWSLLCCVNPISYIILISSKRYRSIYSSLDSDFYHCFQINVYIISNQNMPYFSIFWNSFFLELFKIN